MAVAKKSKASSKGLGKGLGNLIRESEEDENVVVKEVVKEVVVKEPGEIKVRLSQIEPNREQPRKILMNFFNPWKPCTGMRQNVKNKRKKKRS